MVMLTSGCHALVGRDRAFQRLPLATELIRRPPFPAIIGEFAPNDLALVYKGDRRDSMKELTLLVRLGRVRGCRLLVHEDERV
jgi:hypothetical protein